jgi:hypothetical protein
MPQVKAAQLYTLLEIREKKIDKIIVYVFEIFGPKHRSLVCSVVIIAELGREDYGSIPATAIGRRLKPLDDRTDL